MLFLLYNIRSNVITLPFTRYEMRRPYFIIYYNDSNSTRAPVSMNLNTYLPYSIINSNHFTKDTSRIGSDIQIPLEDNDTYFDYRSDIILSDNIIDDIIIKSEYEEFGARKVLRIISKYIENVVIDAIINNSKEVVINSLDNKNNITIWYCFYVINIFYSAASFTVISLSIFCTTALYVLYTSL